jgi:hypothetical protein
MIKIFKIIIMLFISLNAYSQIDYPRYIIDSLGKKVVVMTIEQAQILDNKAELLYLFEKLNSQMGEYDTVCIRVINEKEIVIAEQDVQIKMLQELNDNKDAQIENLKEQIFNYQVKEVLWQEELDNKNSEIDIHLDKIKDMRKKMIIGSIINGVVIIGLIFLLL